MADLRKSLERQMLISRVTQREVMDKVSITEDEARKYHADHAQQFTTPGTITIREILVKVPVTNQGVNVAADEAAKQKAEDARKRVLARRSVRAGGGRGVGLAVEGQRRSRRAAQREGAEPCVPASWSTR